MGSTKKDKELEQHARAALVQKWLPNDRDDKDAYHAKKLTILNIMAINNTLAIEDTKKDIHGVRTQSSDISTMMEDLKKQYEAMERAQKSNQERMDQLGKLLEENQRSTEDARRENQSLGERVRDLVGQSAQVENRVSTLLGNESERINALKALITGLENKLEKQAQRDEFKSEQFTRLDERVKLIQELQLLATSAPGRSREAMNQTENNPENIPQSQADPNQAQSNDVHDPRTHNARESSADGLESDMRMDSEHLDEATIFAACGKYMNSVRWFNRRHTQKPPSGEQKHRFVRKFLEAQTKRVAHYLQSLIIAHFPNIRLKSSDGYSQKRVYGRNRIHLRINVNHITWEDVKAACNDGFDALVMARAQMADDREQENMRRRWTRQDEQSSLALEQQDDEHTVDSNLQNNRRHDATEGQSIKRKLSQNVQNRQWTGEASEL
ncbi:hypothetical protein PFICI_01401 [Pestalotiopsis fici W106-1]|uniref:Uncharacterized protein n=1 Tax=Pestalotiopsis fici (strain W106-1 / CGMCC3.15140) TaxID=1229662 RepID=W3XND9_PESFW|nr:uncharacterized protein PFICI_01401 [Pestalotiopsis fici W106-1]ETS87573.1 hypothetical protein PFICI_01401 [Pestalotiopsis fici W106-1]